MKSKLKLREDFLVIVLTLMISAAKIVAINTHGPQVMNYVVHATGHLLA